MLRRQGKEAGHSQCNTCRNSLGLDPERDPRHDDDQAGWHVRMKEIVAKAPLEAKHDLQTGEFACKLKNKLNPDLTKYGR
jgi:hypothetical protein